MRTITDDKSGIALETETIRPYRVHDGKLGIEAVSAVEKPNTKIIKREAWLCGLSAAGDILLGREPSDGMEAYRTFEDDL
jgi:hypothetical protein